MKLMETQQIQAGDRLKYRPDTYKEGADIYREGTDQKKEGKDGSVEREGEQSGIPVHSIPGKKQCWGSAERGDAVAQLDCHSSSWSPRDRVCDEGVRKQPPLIGNGDTHLAGMMVGGRSR